MTRVSLSIANSSLPFAQGRQALLNALESSGCAVIQAPPGTGKTTLAPGYVHDFLIYRAQNASTDSERHRVSTPEIPSKVVVTQPRRVAARAAAAHVADITGTVLGAEIGYTVRGDSRTSSHTSIEFVTNGVLLRRLLRDPDLEGVGAVIIDEIHERHIESDLLFGMLAQLRGILREDLLLVVMSATVDAQRFASLLGDALELTSTPNSTDAPNIAGTPNPASLPSPNTEPIPSGFSASAPVVDVPSPIYPLEISYASSTHSISTRDPYARAGTEGSVEDHMQRAIQRALSDTATHNNPDIAYGDLLAFVPTIRGCDILAERLHGLHIGGCAIEAYALHGRLSPQEQSRIIGGRSHDSASTSAQSSAQNVTRRVIIATDVAESSVTVPGVRIVVDSCLSRVARRDTSRGMSLLVTESASQASTAQRAGRAGREGPGVVYRCVTAEQWTKLAEFSPPAIATSDLTSALLDCAVWGAPGGEGLPLPDPFPRHAADAAGNTLLRLGAVDSSGRVTGLGRVLASIPLDPHLARGGLLACQRVDVDLVAKVLCVLDATPHSPNPCLEVNALRSSDPAVSRIATILARHAHTAATLPGMHVLKDTASTTTRSHNLDAKGTYLKNPNPQDLYPKNTDSHGTHPANVDMKKQLIGEEAIAYTIACAFPHLIARRVTQSDGSPTNRVLTVGGTGAIMSSIPGAQSSSQWFAIADLARARTTDNTGARVRAALPMAQELAEGAVGGVEKIRTVVFDQQTQKVRAREVKRLGAIELSSVPVRAMSEEAQEAVAEALRQHGADLLPLTDTARSLITRMNYLHAQGVEGYPDLAHGLPEEVVNFAAEDMAAGRSPDITGLLRGLIPWDKPLDQLAPERYTMPNGRWAAVNYPEVHAPDDTPPTIATKLQDAFGLHESPVIAGRKVQFHLLSPAQRPLAVTDDLASFWAGPYHEVRKEMRGRYPKHHWPEDPAHL
ncbi:DEAD/DEAH box helicase [Corynebacterium sp. 4HC-13]|uniref:ATP-dependent helicase C-terminal domain-containing protein n=1 Tax=Corynebacterium anserum TaxID=2684406 RepID=UPI00163B5950|nr:ATP-dependent helicase C-terminal domain-containing protein [Corynebacterium anserum]MBC2682588.1 DEAD/DEAH box helicase [Corynebacterium anserum]